MVVYTCITWHKLPEKTHQLSIVELIECRAELEVEILRKSLVVKSYDILVWHNTDDILVWRNTDDIGFHKPPICTIRIISSDFFGVKFLNLTTIKRPLLQLQRFFLKKMVHYYHIMKETKFEATIFRQYKVDRLMTKHRRTQRRLNLHTLFLSFWSSNNICNLRLITSNIVNIAQFGKGMVKIWGVWCKGVQCLVIGELKWIRTSSLKSLIVASLPLE